ILFMTATVAPGPLLVAQPPLPSTNRRRHRPTISMTVELLPRLQPRVNQPPCTTRAHSAIAPEALQKPRDVDPRLAAAQGHGDVIDRPGAVEAVDDALDVLGMPAHQQEVLADITR